MNDVKYVENNNIYLSNTYKHLVNLYGFDDFYSLYLFSESCESTLVSKGGNKDLSKLKKVKRTVTRNGRPTEMTFYEEASSEDEGNLDKKEKEVNTIQSIKDMEIDVTFNNKKDSVKAHKLNRIFNQLSGESKPFDLTCDSYFSIKDEKGDIVSVGGFKVNGEYLYLSFVKSSVKPEEVQIKAFYELVRGAIGLEKGVMVDINDLSYINNIYELSGLSKEKEFYKMSYKEVLQNFVGE